MLKIKQGETTLLEFLIEDSSGLVVDLTGARFTFTIKSDVDDVDILYQHEEMVTTDPELGIVNIEITSEETAIFPLGTYLGEIAIMNEDNQTFFSNIFKIRVIDVLTV